MKKYLSESLEDTKKIASELSKTIKPRDIIAFKGSMGMGKTAFTSALVDALGTGEVVSSPTFAIVNEYFTDKFLVYHFDMYRITSIDDLYSVGFFDFLETDAVLIIEWSENITEALPQNIIEIEIEKGEKENDRIIQISGGEVL